MVKYASPALPALVLGLNIGCSTSANRESVLETNVASSYKSPCLTITRSGPFGESITEMRQLKVCDHDGDGHIDYISNFRSNWQGYEIGVSHQRPLWMRYPLPQENGCRFFTPNRHQTTDGEWDKCLLNR